MPQIVYQTNVDYAKTYESLYRCSLIDSVDKTPKSGLIWFRFKNTNTVFTISSKGTMQVKWNDVDEKKVLLKQVKTLLIPEAGQKLIVQPLKQQVWIPYDPPEPFKTYWCEQVIEYTRSDSARANALQRFWEELKIAENEVYNGRDPSIAGTRIRNAAARLPAPYKEKAWPFIVEVTAHLQSIENITYSYALTEIDRRNYLRDKAIPWLIDNLSAILNAE